MELAGSTTKKIHLMHIPLIELGPFSHVLLLWFEKNQNVSHEVSLLRSFWYMSIMEGTNLKLRTLSGMYFVSPKLGWA